MVKRSAVAFENKGRSVCRNLVVNLNEVNIKTNITFSINVNLMIHTFFTRKERLGVAIFELI